MLEEEQVGLNPNTGRPKIASEVLEEMRRFLLADTGETLAIKVDKVKKSVREAEKDPLLQKTILRLEQAPVLTTDLNKGKGPVFDYGEKEMVRRNWDLSAKSTKLLADSMKANRNVMLTDSSPRYNIGLNDEAEGYYLDTSSVSLTVFRAGFSEPSSSGTVRKRVTEKLKDRDIC